MKLLQKQELKERLEKAKFDYTTLTQKQYDELTITQLEYMIYKMQGIDFQRRERAASYSIFSRDYTYGDVSYGIMTDTEYERVLRPEIDKKYREDVKKQCRQRRRY